MNPLYSAIVGSLIRGLLWYAASWLTRHGIWSNAEAAQYVPAIATDLLAALCIGVALGWSLIQKWIARRKIVTAVSFVPGLTEHALEAHIASALALPSARTPVDTVPVPVPHA